MRKKIAGFAGLFFSLVAGVIVMTAWFFTDELRTVGNAVAFFLSLAVFFLGAVLLASIRHLMKASETDRMRMAKTLKETVDEINSVKVHVENLFSAVVEAVSDIRATVGAEVAGELDNRLSESFRGLEKRLSVGSDNLDRKLDEVERRLASSMTADRDAVKIELERQSNEWRRDGGWLDRRLSRNARIEFRQIEAQAALTKFLDQDLPIAGTRGWAISPDAALFLVRMLIECRPHSVLDIGSGISTVVIAATLEKLGYGVLTSLEHDPKYAEETLRRLSEAGLEHRCQLVVAPLVQHKSPAGTDWTWYDTNRLLEKGPFDFVFVDGPPHDTAPLARYPTLPLLTGMLTSPCLILLDDAYREDERSTLDLWLSEYPESARRIEETEKGIGIFTLRVSSGFGGDEEE